MLMNRDPQIRVVDRRSERGVLVSVMPMRSGESFNFTRGDFIGLMDPSEGSNRLSMLYHNNSGPTVYFQEEIINPLSESSLMSNDYPLLAVETGISHAHYV
jgi:hypothetical protein